MGNSRRNIQANLKYTVDQGALSQATAANERLAQSYESVQNAQRAQDSIAQSVAASQNRVASELTQTRTAADSAASSIDRLADRQRRLSAQNDRFDAVSRDVGLAGDVQSNLGAVSGLAGAAGAEGVATGLDVAGEIVVLAEELPRLKTAVQGLPNVARAAAAALGPAGFALGGIIAALGAVALLAARELERAKEAAAFASEQQQRYNEFLGQTSDQLEGVIGSGDADRAIADIQQTEQDLAQVLDSINERLGTSFDVSDVTGGDLESRANRAFLSTEAIVNNDASVALRLIEEYNNAVATGTPLVEERLAAEAALNDTTRQSTEITQQFVEASRQAVAERQKEIDSQAELTRQTRLFIETSDADAIRSRVEALEAERASLEQALEQENISADLRQQYEQDLSDINDQLKILNSEGAKRVENLEKEAEAARRNEEIQEAAREQAERRAQEAEQRQAEFVRNAEQLAEKESRQRDKIAEIQQSIVDLRTKSAQRIQQIEQQLATRLTQLARQRDSAIATAQRQAATERENAAIDAAQSIANVEQELASQRAQITRQFAIEQENAIGNRDALALFQAQRQAAEEQRTAEQNAQDRIRQIDQQLQNQNRLIAQRLAEQTQVANERYAEQIQAAREAAQLQIQQERQQLQQQIAERQRALAEETRLLQQFVQQGTQLFAQFTQNNISFLSQQLQAQSRLQQAFAAQSQQNLSTQIQRELGSLLQ